MTNPFEQLADRQLTGAQKAADRRQERVRVRREERERPPTALEQRQMDNAVLLKLYRAWRRELRANIVRRHGRDFAALMKLLRNLDWRNVDAVVDFVSSAWWLRRADETTRLATLGYIDESICRARIRHGLSTFDDGLPGEDPGPAIHIRRLLMGH